MGVQTFALFSTCSSTVASNQGQHKITREHAPQKSRTYSQLFLNEKSRQIHAQKIGTIAEFNPIFRNFYTITAVV